MRGRLPLQEFHTSCRRGCDLRETPPITRSRQNLRGPSCSSWIDAYRLPFLNWSTIYWSRFQNQHVQSLSRQFLGRPAARGA